MLKIILGAFLGLSYTGLVGMASHFVCNLEGWKNHKGRK